MKLVLILAITMMSQFSFAAFETKAEQKALAEKVAKEARREMHVGGYDDVATSTPELVTLAFLNEYKKGNSQYENPLEDAEYTKLFNCVKSSACALWNFRSSSSMYGGFGEASHFVLMYLQSGKHFVIMHGIYAE